MKQRDILNSIRLPARLDVQQTALALGFNEHDIQILIRARLLRSLGNPAPNAPKYFASCEVELLAVDPDWLNKATRTIASNWRKKNDRQSLHAS
jgi:hypothetical protein